MSAFDPLRTFSAFRVGCGIAPRSTVHYSQVRDHRDIAPRRLKVMVLTYNLRHFSMSHAGAIPERPITATTLGNLNMRIFESTASGLLGLGSQLLILATLLI
jgi:hypothetical protein